MDFSQLSRAYFDTQKERVSELIERISERDMVVTDGRQVPTEGSLPIGVGKRIQAAVMFIDIVSFSARPSATKKEQENILRVIALFFPEMIKIIEDYGGVVEKNTGDGLMAYFAYDASEQSTASQRAAAAGMTMFYAAKHLLNPVIVQSGFRAVDFRVCIDHGNITIAEVGAARRFHSFVAIGSTANIACKLLKFCSANQIVIGANVFHGLPEQWKQWCVLQDVATGFVYVETGNPYPCYHFNAHWRPFQ